MSQSSDLARLLSPSATAIPDGVDIKSSPLLPSKTVRSRMHHLDSGVYDLSPSSHLMRFAGALLGDAGAGMLRKHSLLARLSQTISGANFVDLDRFYGALFNIGRTSGEHLGVNPMTDIATSEVWEVQHARDGSYRSRLFQFARAINEGPTPMGLRLAAEALLSVGVDIHEVWRYIDEPGHFEADLSAIGSRREFVIRPHREVELDERRILLRVLDRLRPADSSLTLESTGLALYDAVTLADVRADSEWWEVTTHVSDRIINGQTPYGTGSGEMVELPRPPLSGYQGEVWSYYADISSVTGYTDSSRDINFQRVKFTDGTSRDYLPSQALLSAQDWLGGRMASDGAAVVHPLTARTGKQGTLYLDRVAVNDFMRVGLLGFTEAEDLGSSKEKATFWVSKERPNTDPTIEYLEVTLTSPRIVNRVMCLLPRFPHDAMLEVRDEGTGQWVQVDSHATNDSRPSLIGQTDPDPGVHPLHHGPSHWQDINFEFPARTIERLRIGLRRSPGGSPPRNRQGEPLAYSLAVRALEVGYRVARLTDVPNDALQADQGLIATSKDAFGTTTEFRFRRDPASHLLVDDDRIWRSESLPTPDAVVNLYVDTRNEEGVGQRIGRFYLEPLTEGVSMTLYHSNDEPHSDFLGANDLLEFTQEGTITLGDRRYSFNETAPAWLDVANHHIRFNPEQAWWMGVSLLTGAASTHSADHPVFSFGGRELLLETGGVRFRPLDGGDLNVVRSYSKGAQLDIIIGYLPEPSDDYDAGYYLIVRHGSSAPQVEHLDDITSMDRPGVLRIGGSFVNESLISGMRLEALTIKEEPLQSASIERFFDDPIRAVTSPRWSHERPDDTRNALMRLATTLRGNQDVGLRGGPPNHFAEMRWTPVAADYKLTKGYITVPSRPASFWKMEFTGLVAEPFEAMVDLLQDVNIHPEHNRNRHSYHKESRSDSSMSESIAALHEGFRSHRGDAATYTSSDPETRRVYGLGNLEALVAGTPEAASKLRERSWLYGWEPYHQEPTSPTFEAEAKHLYETRQVAHGNKTGYFVGLRRLVAYTVDREGLDDAPLYEEDMSDQDSVVESNWSQGQAGWVSTSSSARAVSRTYKSHSYVEALQFAADFSAPAQLLPDPDFRDRMFLNRTNFSDPNQWHGLGDVRIIYRDEDYAVDISRYGERTWGMVEELGTYGDLEAFTYGQLESISLAEFTSEAGLVSPPVAVSGSRRRYVAARVVGIETLPSPLWLQLVDEDNNVIVERSFTPVIGEGVDVYVGHRESGFRTYGEVEALGTYGDLEAVGTYGEIESEAGLAGSVVRGRIVQKGEHRGAWRVIRLGIFDVSVTWEFTVNGGASWFPADDIANNPYGVIRFPVPGNEVKWRANAHRRGAHINSLQLRPWYLGEPQDARVYDGQQGGNLTMSDILCRITDEPQFKRWHLPIPEWWYLLRRRADITAIPRERVLAPMVEVNVGVIEPAYVGFISQPEPIHLTFELSDVTISFGEVDHLELSFQAHDAEAWTGSVAPLRIETEAIRPWVLPTDESL